MGHYFTVGEFAKLHGMSKQTLIFYDKIGLIKPDYVDVDNGYRYYSGKQLEILDTITMLKEIGAPLSEIRKYMEGKSMEGAIKLLEEKNIELKKKIKKQIRINSRLEAKLTQLKDAELIGDTEKIRYEVQHQKYLFAEKVKTPHSIFEADLAIKKMFEHASNEKIEHNYQICTIIPYQGLMEGKFIEASNVYTIMDRKVKSEHLITVPKGLFAVFFHKGAYANTPATYRKALDKISDDGYKITGDSYEECIVDNFTSDREEDYLTKISIPVEKMI